MKWANKFNEIEDTILERKDIREKMIELIEKKNIAGKVLEGGNRLNDFRNILKKLVNSELTYLKAISETELYLSKENSMYKNNGRVFSSDWAERLVKIQYSRFYNQAVMCLLLNSGETMCFVPTTLTQDPDSPCSKYLANRAHDINLLLDRLVDSYEKGNFTKEPMIPNHLHCSHVIKPIE
jgi:hypothetical protein